MKELHNNNIKSESEWHHDPKFQKAHTFDIITGAKRLVNDSSGMLHGRLEWVSGYVAKLMDN